MKTEKNTQKEKKLHHIADFIASPVPDAFPHRRRTLVSGKSSFLSLQHVRQSLNLVKLKIGDSDNCSKLIGKTVSLF